MSASRTRRRPAGLTSGIRAEEVVQSVGGLVWDLFREEMAARKRASLDLVGPIAPECEGATRVGIPVIEGTHSAPKRQERASDSPAIVAIRLIVREIEGRRCAIFLADGVNARRVAQCIDIGRAHLRAKDRAGRSPRAKRVVDDGLRGGCDEEFGQRFRLQDMDAFTPLPSGVLSVPRVVAER